jgi:tRNA (Thr-GGU) A37 N-methylase
VTYQLTPIGRVASPLTDRAFAPKQGDQGAPDAELIFDEAVADGLRDLRPGTDAIVLTWLDRAARDVLVVHPRGDLSRPPTGVFSTRSPDRPNPIGLHRARARGGWPARRQFRSSYQDGQSTDPPATSSTIPLTQAEASPAR